MVIMFLQWQLAIVVNVVMKLYYKEVLDPTFNYASKMQELMKKTMDQVRTQNYNAFLKHLHICNPILGHILCEQQTKGQVVQVVESPAIAKEVTKFSKQGFFDAICGKWLQKAIFWFQASSTHYSNPNEICPFGNFWC